MRGDPRYIQTSHHFCVATTAVPSRPEKSRTAHIPRWVSSWSHSDDDPGKVACPKAGAAGLQQEDIGPEERDEIERLLEKIEAALDLLDKAGSSGL
jgi:hypothetical protein